MERKEYRSLLKHHFWGNFDTGVIFIFLSLYIWDQTENMLTIALAFSIPLLINTVVDYYFSYISDKSSRIKLIIIGNIGSAIFLSLYGVASNMYTLYVLIFFKSLFAKLYSSSLDPYTREIIKEDEYKEYIAKLNIKISVGSSIGGFALMFLFIYTNSISLVFILSGLIELYSTVFLFKLKDAKLVSKKKAEDQMDFKWLKEITIIYTIKAFGIALILNRMLIFLYGVHNLKPQDVGLVFFIVYGISNMLATRVYGNFKNISLKNMFIISFVFQAVLLILFTKINKVKILILIWFIYEVVSAVANIYAKDRINKSLFTDIGTRLSKFRISISAGSIVGQLVISQIWDRVGINSSFYYSSAILIVLSMYIFFKNESTLNTYTDKQAQENHIYP